MTAFSHFRLLLWKNFKLQFRQPWGIVAEIGTPCLFVLMIAAVRMLVAPDHHPEGANYPVYGVLENPIKNRSIDYAVMYAPNASEQINDAIEHLIGYLNSDSDDNNTYTAYSYATEQSLLIEYRDNANNGSILENRTVLCGIVFESYNNLNAELKYKIRFPSTPPFFVADNDAITWKTDFTFPQFSIPGPREPNSNYGWDPGYYEEGFMLIQHLVSIAVANVTANSSTGQTLFTVNAQRMPYPPYIADNFLVALQFMMPMIFLLSFIYPLSNLTKNIVLEKERRLKEYMKMMGLKNWLHWVAWFVKSLVWIGISVKIITAILLIHFKDGVGVLTNSDFLVIYIFFLLYAFATISFGFMLSTLFSKANVAGVGGGVIFFFCFMPYFALANDYRNLSLAAKLGGSLLSNTALGFGSTLISMWEGNNVGVRWSNIAKPSSPDDSLTMLHIWMMFVIDTILYLTITWYVEAVFPGEYGVPQKWYFFATKSYWFGSDEAGDTSVSGRDNFSFEIESNIETPSKRQKLVNLEQEPQGLKAGIKIKKLSKTFDGGDTYAVNDLSLNTYSGQITALLGHNGAGKTTTMSIITGLFPPTKGTVIVNGYDIRTDLSKVHDSLGICPQFDVLFDMLTVEEHMQFFCKLKNFDPKKTESEITRIIEILGLEDKRKAQSRTLSGGMRRKLSVGIALVGGSKIVILDEPTSGMDVSARRFTWDLLLQEKEGRTILLSTHFMEEADVLGDRIAIMATGELQCCGSPLYLKKKYGAGYHLTIVKKSDSIDAQPITRLIKGRVTNAKMENAAGAEICFSLPNEESYRFESLFSELETSKAKLGIDSYGISITTMEEVFLKVGQYAEEGIKAINENQHNFNGNNNNNNNSRNGSYSPSSMYGMGANSSKAYRNTGMKLMVQQFHGLLMKKILFSWRNPALTLSQLLLPFLLMIFSMAMLQTIPKPQDSPILSLNLNSFKGTNTYVFLRNKTGLAESFIDKYKSQFDSTNDLVHEVLRDIPLNNHSNDYLVELGKKELTDLNLHTPISVIVGTDNEEDSSSSHLNLTALYNNQAFHTPAITISFVDHVILKLATNNPSYSFQVWNHPLPRTLKEELKQNQDNQQLQVQISQQLMFAMAFLIASFSVLLVRERSIKSKHLQQVCGVRLYLFWLSSFLWDFLIYMIPCFLIMLVFVMFNTEGYKSGDQEARILLIFFVHGLAVIPFVYAVSFFFDVPSSAYVRICLFAVILGSGSFIAVTVTEIPSLNIVNVSKVLDWLFALVLPNYCLGRAFFNMYVAYITNKVNKMYGFKEIDYLDWEKPGIGRQLVLLLIQAVYYWIIVVLIELNVFRSIKYYFMSIRAKRTSDYSSNGFEEMDDDVRAEKKRLESTDLLTLTKSDALVIKNLTKLYGDFCAVDNISYGVRRGECFGLLGVNGAGKTTSFKMITGDEPITSGDIYIDGLNVKNSIRKVQRQIGYCPQFDGLLDQMTGRETLTLFCRLRGIVDSDITHEIDDISKLLYFDMHIDKLVGKYSGGTKRKLSTAVALLGDPPVSFLDEPTTGVDPVARRCLWDALTKKLSLGSSIVLTSHSMEECEALCNRLIIMVNGKICCIGSSQQLKNKFGKGYTVLVKVSAGGNPRTSSLSQSNNASPTRESLPNIYLQRQNSVITNNQILEQNIRELKSFMSESFPGSELKGVHNNLLHYHISDESSISWSKLFGLIEKAKDRLKIEDYSIGQTTLEQIFLSFARQQRESSDQ